jgi:hypothetical protein
MSFDLVRTKLAVSATPSIALRRLLSVRRNPDVPRSQVAWIARFLTTLTIALVCTAFAKTAFAQQTGKVVEFGIYSDERKLLKKTTSIPIKGGVRFGFCFEADIDFSEDSYMLIESLAHPPIPVRDSGEDAGYSVPRMFEVRDGVARGCSGYRARDVSDLRRGVWKFTISDGEEVLVVQEFSVR